MLASCIPPYSVKCQPGCRQIYAIYSDCSRRERVQPEQRCRKWHETDGQKEENVDPQENPVSPFDIMKLIVMANPIHAQHDKTENVGENMRREIHDLTLKVQLGQTRPGKTESQN